MTSITTLSTPRSAAARKPVGLALQGGGSWGAYTWGVLDALLSGRSLSVAQLSGTSAGAINAAIVTGALARGSPADGRKLLRTFWTRMAESAASDIAYLWTPAGRALRHSFGAWLVSSGAISPYTVNPLGVNPLRDALVACVDIDAIRSKFAPALFVTVTNVRTGLPRVISNDAMSIDALLASACIPELFQAVELDGEPYWDGAYCGNPTLWPMIHSGLARDMIVVQLAPEVSTGLPVDAASIRRRVGEIVFNSSLVAEMQAITAMRALAARSPDPASVLDIRMHRIGPPAEALLKEGSASDRSRAWLERLHEDGVSAGRRFVARHGADIGVRETLDIVKAFSDGHKLKMRAPANEATYDAVDMPDAADAEVSQG